MITIKSDKKSYGINFPTSLKEITPEVLNTICANVKLPEHYCIIAMTIKTTLFEFCTSLNKKSTNASVLPMLAKISDEDSKLVHANVGDKIIIDRSSLERGVHINFNTMISATNAQNYLASDQDIVKAVLKNDNSIIKYHDLGLITEHPTIILLEFKICPVVDIAAAIPTNENSVDPFIYTDGVCEASN